jgi:hypothetical protein
MRNRNAPEGPAQYTELALFIYFFLLVSLIVWVFNL